MRLLTTAKAFYRRLSGTPGKLNRELELLERDLENKRRELLEVTALISPLMAELEDAYPKAEALSFEADPSAPNENWRIEAEQLIDVILSLGEQLTECRRNFDRLRFGISAVEQRMMLEFARRDLLLLENERFPSSSERVRLQSYIASRETSLKFVTLESQVADSERAAAKHSESIQETENRFTRTKPWQQVFQKFLCKKRWDYRVVSEMAPEDYELMLLASSSRIRRAAEMLELRARILYLSCNSALHIHCMTLVRQGSVAAIFILEAIKANVAIEQQIRSSNSSDKALLKQELFSETVTIARMELQLFQLDCLIRRVYVVKLMMTAVPKINAEHLQDFENLLRQLPQAIGAEWRENVGEEKLLEKKDFTESLNSLESKVQRSFLALAEKMESEPDQTPPQLQKRLSEISKTIEVEMMQQNESYKQWHWNWVPPELVNAENGPVRAVVAARGEACALVLKSLERTKEVASVVSCLIGRGDDA